MLYLVVVSIFIRKKYFVFHTPTPTYTHTHTHTPTTIFPHALAIFWSAGKRCKDTFSPVLRHLSPVIHANATVVAFVLLRNSRFNFHCYSLREPTPTQISARRCQLRPFATSCAKDYKGYSLVQTSFAELLNSVSEGGSQTCLVHVISDRYP